MGWCLITNHTRKKLENKIGYFLFEIQKSWAIFFLAEYLCIYQPVKNTKLITDMDWEVSSPQKKERLELGKKAVIVSLKWLTVGSPLKKSKLAFLVSFFLFTHYPLSLTIWFFFYNFLKLYTSQNFCSWGPSRRYSQ